MLPLDRKNFNLDTLNAMYEEAMVWQPGGIDSGMGSLVPSPPSEADDVIAGLLAQAKEKK